MCGRYQIDMEVDEQELKGIFASLNKKYAGTEALAAIHTGEIYPTNLVPILGAKDGELRPSLMTWGFPRWDGKGSIINARSETVAEKSMFRKPFAQSRCIVPTTGFYEWKAVEGQRRKDKYLFRLPGSDILYLAGIHNEFAQPDGTKRAMFVILTTAANESMRAYHNRMPVMIRPEEADEWVLGDRAAVFIAREQPELVAIGA